MSLIIFYTDWLYNGTVADGSMEKILEDDCQHEEWSTKLQVTRSPIKSSPIPWNLFGKAMELSDSDGTTRKCKLRRLRAVQSPRIAPFPFPRPSPPKVTVNVTLPTLLDDHPVQFTVIRPNVTTSDSSEVNAEAWPLFRSVVLVDHQATQYEGIARNGAIHVIGRLLHPVNKTEAAWDDWESWLPEWAEAQ